MKLIINLLKPYIKFMFTGSNKARVLIVILIVITWVGLCTYNAILFLTGLVVLLALGYTKK